MPFIGESFHVFKKPLTHKLLSDSFRLHAYLRSFETQADHAARRLKKGSHETIAETTPCLMNGREDCDCDEKGEGILIRRFKQRA
jgi:hypothetical protein